MKPRHCDVTRGNLTPVVVLGTGLRQSCCGSRIAGRKWGPDGICLFLLLDLAPHHHSPATKLLKAKKLQAYLSLGPTTMQENKQNVVFTQHMMLKSTNTTKLLLKRQQSSVPKSSSWGVQAHNSHCN